jgi:ATP-binding cassette subfamily B protein
MARLLELAFIKKGLSLSACVLSVVSVAVSFTPYIAVYYIIRELVTHFNNLSALDTALMIRLGWLAFGGAAAAVLLNWFALLCSHIAAFTTLYKLKLDFTGRIAALPLGFHTASSTGKLRKVADENIEKLEGFIAHQLPDIAGAFAMPAITLVILFVFDWRLGLAGFAPIIVSYIIQTAAFGSKPARVFMEKYQSSLEDMNSSAVEYVRGIPVIKAFNQTVYSFRKFRESIAAYGAFVKDYTLSFGIYMQLFLVIIHHVHLFLLPAIILLAGGAADYGVFALAALFYLIFSFSIATPFTKVLYVSELGRQIADGIERMDKMLDTSALPEAAEPKTTAEYSVKFENVTFYYEGGSPLETSPSASLRIPPGSSPASGGSSATPQSGGAAPATTPSGVSLRETPQNDGPPARHSATPPPLTAAKSSPALSKVSFTAKQGEVTALVGPSGGGKSTIAHLLPRFYDVAEGAISIGGVDIRNMAGDYLMSLVSFVFQDLFLFKESVLENIRVGNKDASREQAIAAAKAAQCHGFVEKLPQGYDTVIGAKNVHLSGGEKQRVVIARAILKNAPILVLDEATAFADPENERQIQLALGELVKNKTVIIIAHRLSTVRNADSIVVIDKGAVLETGRHDELAAKGGRYRRMWEQYTAALDWTVAGKKE